ncbi:MAG: DUF58 domain-containing protein [Armatimonadota bacterium]|nr:DUF58 domain-containing protein [Armatimonadota bacterium]
MIPTGPLIGILAAAIPLFALGVVEPMLPLAGVGVMLGALVLAIVDGRLSRARDTVEVQRRLPQVLSLGVPNRVVIWLRNRSDRPLTLQVRDDPPPQFDTPERSRRLQLDAWEHRRVSYQTTPNSRGDWAFGDLHIRVLSRLRLVWWQRDIAAPESVRVYPNLQQVREFDALARRGRLEEIGLRTARARGEGTEFESLREYVPDDSFRHIDWKATARRGTPITRQYQVERNQTLIIMIDSGRLMAARSGDMTRVDCAVNAALMLAHVAQRMGDTVGLIVFSDRVKTFVTPSHGAAQTQRILEELYALQAELVEPDFRAAISFLRSHARKRAMICAFTDLVEPEVSAQALSYLSSLRPQHLPLVATVPDEEITAMAAGSPDDVLGAYEKALASRTLSERALALARLRSRGVLACDARPDDLAAAVVNRYLTVKRAGLL